MQHFTHKLWLKSETNVKFTGKKMGEEEGEEERKELGRKETLSSCLLYTSDAADE